MPSYGRGSTLSRRRQILMNVASSIYLDNDLESKRELIYTNILITMAMRMFFQMNNRADDNNIIKVSGSFPAQRNCVEVVFI